MLFWCSAVVRIGSRVVLVFSCCVDRLMRCFGIQLWFGNVYVFWCLAVVWIGSRVVFMFISGVDRLTCCSGV